MECYFCKIKMKKVKMIGDISGMAVYISTKEKGFIGTEKKSAVNTYVCPKCGRIEMIADNLVVFK